MKARIAIIVASARKVGPGRTVYHELTPDLYSATSKTFVGKVYAALGLQNIADAADSGGTGYPQLSAEYVVSASPDVIVLADTVCWSDSGGRRRPPRLGSRRRAVKTPFDRADPRLDRVAVEPGLVDFYRAVAAALQTPNSEHRRRAAG